MLPITKVKKERYNSARFKSKGINRNLRSFRFYSVGRISLWKKSLDKINLASQ